MSCTGALRVVEDLQRGGVVGVVRAIRAINESGLNPTDPNLDLNLDPCIWIQI